jgi:hypothetical protein
MNAPSRITAALVLPVVIAMPVLAFVQRAYVQQQQDMIALQWITMVASTVIGCWVMVGAFRTRSEKFAVGVVYFLGMMALIIYVGLWTRGY